MSSAAGGQPFNQPPSSNAPNPSVLFARPDAQRAPRVITTRPQIAISDLELRARIQWAQRVSPHFAVSYDLHSFADPQAATLIDALEDAYSLIFSLTHESFTERLQVYVIDQRATPLLGSVVCSHFSAHDRSIYLVQSSSQHLYTELVRLLAHAMRFPRYARHYGRTRGWSVLEEGFAIFLNERLSVLHDVFPFYGADPDVIAFQTYSKLAKGSLRQMWEQETLPLSLEQQLLAGAFFLYLGDTFSDDRVVTFSKVDGEVTNETFRDFFGEPLAELESAWADHLPISQLSLTHDEMEEMVLRWDQHIECKRH